ncbi:glycoside hydrolase family protein [Paenibacillus sp. CC-CFT747]|nr:glycoside hydrolase family protein [Paenibacillus sp. CC-CFT747]
MDFNGMMKPVPRTAVFRMDDYLVWCGSMVEHDGKYYLFFSRWPKAKGHYAWVTCSEVAYAVADHPLGPYTYEGMALAGSGGGNWDAATIHNPTVVPINGKYYMYYMGTKGPASYQTKPTMNDPEWWEYRNNQRVGVAVADHPAGPWQRFDKPCVDVTPGSFDHLATNNPSVAQGPDGRIYMVYKAVGDGPMPKGGGVICGVAVADDPAGPFEKMPEPIMVNPEEGWSVEDPFIWVQDGRFYALVKDFQGYFTKRGKQPSRFLSPAME